MNPNATQMPLPWAGLPGVKCSLQRTESGQWTGQCVINTAPGGQPIVLTAKANEQDVFEFLRQRYMPQGGAAAGFNLGQLAAQARKMTQGDVLKKLTQAYRKVSPAMGAPAIPAAARFIRGAKNLGINPYQAARLAKVPLSQLPLPMRRHLAARLQRQRRAPRTPGTVPTAVTALRNAAMLLVRSRAGVPTARAALLKLRQRVMQGDKAAQRSWAILKQAAKTLPHPKSKTTAGWAAVAGCGMPPGTVAGWQAPMNLQNYYQIMGNGGGAPVVAGQHYGIAGDVMGLKCHTGPALPEALAHTHAVTCEPGAAISGHDWTIGANGRPVYKTWNGARWIWSELRPHYGIRSEAQGFGLRDALLLGMQTMQSRELAAA